MGPHFNNFWQNITITNSSIRIRCSDLSMMRIETHIAVARLKQRAEFTPSWQKLSRIKYCSGKHDDQEMKVQSRSGGNHRTTEDFSATSTGCGHDLMNKDMIPEPLACAISKGSSSWSRVIRAAKRLLASILIFGGLATAQNTEQAKIEPPDAEWIAKIEGLAPKKPRVAPKSPRKVLVCSLATGYCHDVIPHVKQVMDTLAATGAFSVVHSDDVDMFAADKLAEFDAVVLNNTCTRKPAYNWFIDTLAADPTMDARAREQRAAQLEKNLIAFVEGGKGLVAVHGAVVFLNESEDFSHLLGASFRSHPALQTITLKPVEPDHPLLQAFGGKPFTHLDEPYLFHKAYAKKDFRPLLEMEVSKLDAGARKMMGGDRRYVSWIRHQGKGRVFYVSPSHHPSSYERAELLQFYIDGIQYALGDLVLDDRTPGAPAK